MDQGLFDHRFKNPDAVARLLAVVVGQDTEPDPDRVGKWRIAHRVATPDRKNRPISVVDPQARHARKTRSQRRDGYKAHIAAEPDTGIITACDVTSSTPAHSRSDFAVSLARSDTPDGVIGVKMLEDEDSGLEIIADSAYGSGKVRAELEKAGHRATIKPRPQSTSWESNPRLGADQFTRDDFSIDHHQRQVTCPAGRTTTINTQGWARFGRHFAPNTQRLACNGCPVRVRCTTNLRGRTLKIHPHDRPGS